MGFGFGLELGWRGCNNEVWMGVYVSEGLDSGRSWGRGTGTGVCKDSWLVGDIDREKESSRE